MQPKPVVKIPAQLHIGNLDSKLKEADLFSLLARFGEVSHIKLKHLPTSCYAFVAFKDPETSLTVQKDLNGYTFHNKRIQISRTFDTSNPANVYIKNIPEHITPRDLGELFGRFGSILSCKVCYDETGKSLGYGFVQYESREFSDTAIHQMNGKVWQGNELTVQYFLPLSARINNTANSNLYIRGFNENYTDEMLKNVFSQYGQVLSVAKMTYSGRAFGFVCFSSASEARIACEQKHNEVEGDFTWYVTPHMSKIHRKKMLREKYLSQVEEWKKRNLYIKNLDRSIDEHRLQDICSAYGPIDSLKICKMENIKYDSDGNCVKEPISKEIAYVLYQNEASAKLALIELQKKLIEGKKLYVARWKPREALKKLITNSKAQKVIKFGQMPGRGILPPRGMPFMNYPPRGMPGIPVYQGRGRGRSVNVPPPIINREEIKARVVNPTNYDTMDVRELGERLYPNVFRLSNREVAGKITGMLLEMEKSEVATLINDEGRLLARIKEAVEVLKRAWAGNDDMLSKLPKFS